MDSNMMIIDARWFTYLGISADSYTMPAEVFF